MQIENHTRSKQAEPENGESLAGNSLQRKEQIKNLYEKHNRSLIRFLSARMHSKAEAEELAQEAYVRLLRRDELDTISDLRAFLFRIAANLVTDRLKQRDSRVKIRSLIFFDMDESGPGPERVLAANVELALVREAVEELPAKCRMAFLLHKIHEVTVTETAERMGMSVRMVRLYVARALTHCREKLDAAQQPARLKQ